MSKSELADACWQRLSSSRCDEISLSLLAQDCNMSPSQAVIEAGSVTNLICYQLDKLDQEALLQSAEDFADDPHARIYDKLLEGLMMRFELFAPYRAQFDNLHHSAKRNPALALHLAHHLQDMIGRLLTLAGDETIGPRKQARIFGVGAVLMRVRATWIKDEGADLGLTLKALDDELKKACEWALSLKILSQDDIGQG